MSSQLVSPLLQAFDSSWRHETLANGMQLVHIPLERDERFYLGATLRVGVRYEGRAHSGLSHFLEHMMFRGSKNYPSFSELAKAFEWLGGEWNAATGYEHTEYWYSGHRAMCEKTIALFREFLFHPLLLDIETEREIVKRELMKELNEYGHSIDLDQHNLAQMWPRSSLARPILGSPEFIDQFTKKRLIDYRSEFYCPENMVICAVGGSAKDGMLERLASAFGKYRAKALGRAPKVPPTPKAFRGPAIKWVNNPDNEYQIQLSFRVGGEWSKEASVSHLLCRILADGFSSRLAAHLREKLGLVYDIDASASLMSDLGSIDINSAVGPEQFMLFFRELFLQLKALAESGPTEEEVARTKRRAVMELELLPAEPEVLAYRFGWSLLMGKRPSLVNSAAKLQRIEVRDVHQLAARAFRKSRLSLVILGPKNKSLEAKLQTLVQGVW